MTSRIRRRTAMLVVLALAAPLPLGALDLPERPLRPVSTYSIVARDPETGQLGVAVQSHWFSVGTAVPWAEAGVGAVATQSLVDITYGPLGLDLMRAGRSASETLRGLLAADPHPEIRQVAMIDASGAVAVHTGSKCIAEAGHRTGRNYSVQANLMESDEVWPAMARAFEEAEGPLAERMLAALEAAQGEGGDIRGRQSAAILVVSGEPSGKPWTDRLVDLRVEDHPTPVKELERLLHVHRAYQHMNKGDLYVEEEDFERAFEEYARAADMLPDQLEPEFWRAVALATHGRMDEALPVFGEIFEKNPRWAKLVPRLPHAGLLPDDPELIEAILEVAPEKVR
jgi:uncharacterized Ntn-hydrolase superfamily protein